MTMNNLNPEALAQSQDYHTDMAAVALLWVLLLALIVVIKIWFLPVTRWMLAAVLP
jgi:hypothetical protein